MRRSWSALREDLKRSFVDAFVEETCSCALGLICIAAAFLWTAYRVSRWALVLAGIAIAVFVLGRMLSRNRSGRLHRRTRSTDGGGDARDDE